MSPHVPNIDQPGCGRDISKSGGHNWKVSKVVCWPECQNGPPHPLPSKIEMCGQDFVAEPHWQSRYQSTDFSLRLLTHPPMMRPQSSYNLRRKHCTRFLRLRRCRLMSVPPS